ncbi:hypothetical protein BABINDRAFT_161476 [Babjeviella inositovora NRRL Y-12698]|uniref:nitric oxide dioxygenase n=1 Tax=Babjeviella inositovora NRRL Y-12698 TaxID=984486 RepID=A0A1E3QQ45_9ASCO|nr:uncharacterized protein BABINDRAFT_161476 [Babjeviella inositovora NRRL Y-12698]ODQ79780.1 hypothetical protein BABINDRAFT_161476 [Babjeviella inositovora NRRL Y-12698]
MPLTDVQKDIIKASIPVLKTSGVELTTRFYAHLLENHPDVRPFFNKAHQITKSQPKILAFALVAYAKNIDDLTPLLPFVHKIVVKHIGLQVQARHYDAVGTSLLHTLHAFLGGDAVATPEFMGAWKVAYYDLANILIEAEKSGYEKQQAEANSWAGFRDFQVSQIVDECKDVKSVYFKPVGGNPKLVQPLPGQYVCARWTINGAETSREYSLSLPDVAENTSHFRISCRRDTNNGVVSNFIHSELKVGDVVKITPPCGDFVYQKPVEKTGLSLFVGGIGITPALSIIKTALADDSTKDVRLFYSNSDAECRAFADQLHAVAEAHPNFKLIEFVSAGNAKESDSVNHTVHNRRLAETDFDFVTNALDYYVLGPQSYMKFVTAAIGAKGVTAEIRTESFTVTSA